MHPARYLGLVNLSTPRDATQNLFPLLNCKSMTLSRPPNSKRSIFHYSWQRDGAEHLPLLLASEDLRLKMKCGQTGPICPS